jgi:hypothetical protein
MHAAQQLPSTKVRACGPTKTFVQAAIRPRVQTRAYLEEKQTGAGQTAQGSNQLEGKLNTLGQSVLSCSTAAASMSVSYAATCMLSMGCCSRE